VTCSLFVSLKRTYLHPMFVSLTTHSGYTHHPRHCFTTVHIQQTNRQPVCAIPCNQFVINRLAIGQTNGLILPATDPCISPNNG